MAKRKRRASSSSSPPKDVNKCSELIDLPREIVAEIMSRLSTESLMRFKSLSKPWCSVIRCLVRDPAFVAQHHRRAEARPTLRLIRHPRYGRISYTDFAETAGEDGEIRCVTKHIGATKHVDVPMDYQVLHCNGIFFHRNRGPLTLYNPVINKFLTFHPRMVKKVENDIAELAMGFGSDYGSTSFKFVWICEPKITRPMIAQVYDPDQSDDSWREIEFPVHVNKLGSGFSNKSVYANGHCHWLIEDPPSCLCFDVAAESFRTVDLPVELVATGYFQSFARLEAREGSLCLIYRPPCHPMDVWVMNDTDGFFSWSKRLRIPCPFTVSRPLTLWSSDKLVMMTCDGGLVSYNFRTIEFKKLPVDVGSFHYLGPWVDNLASVIWMNKHGR